MNARRAYPMLTLLSLALAGCGATQLTPPPASTPDTLVEPSARAVVTRIDVTPGASMLTAAGQTTPLTATLYDAQNRPVSGTVKWVSSNPAAVEVSAKGVAKARVAVGSSLITAEVNGVKSRPVLVSVVKLNANAVVVTDAQIVSQAALLTPGPNGSPLGARVSVTLSGVTPKAGQVLLSSGVSPVSGRVLSSVPSGKQTVVTLETVELADLYQDLSVSQRVQLSAANVVPLTGAQAPERVERHADGSLTVSYRLPKEEVLATRSGMRSLSDGDGLPGPFVEKKFKVGIFDCSTTLDVLLSGDLISLKIESKLDVDVQASVQNASLQSLSMRALGDVSGTVTGGLDLDLGAQGELKCSAVFARVPVPVTGPLASFVAPTVPIGLRFVLDGKLKLGKVQFAMEGKVSGKVNAGFGYDRATGEVTSVRDVNASTSWTPKLKLPSTPEDFRMESGLAVQVLSGFDVTAFPWLGPTAPSFKALEVTYGPKLESNLAPIFAQATTNDYASSYALKMIGGVGPGETLQELFGVLSSRNQIKLFNFAPLVEYTLSRSPNGAMSGESALKVGQQGTVHVELTQENVNFLPGVYNVAEVQLYRERKGLLEFAGRQTALDGQTRFDFPWTPAAADAGQTVVFRAFVVSRATPFALELDDDAKYGVAVTTDQTPPPPPPVEPEPPVEPSGQWVGSTRYEWTGNESRGPYDGIVSSTTTSQGAVTCTLGEVDAAGAQTANWTYVMDERVESVDTNDYRTIVTRTANLAGTSAFPPDPYGNPDDYVLEVRKVYGPNGVLYSLGTNTYPVNAGSACTLWAADDENPDPSLVQGHRVTHEPNPSWTQLYEVNVTLK
ncbi:Ig-like domain-containing protein [Deinococcus pimensis]|uniref:Ig-like domain-containing protein n=1 Tax=Deinococcus pimensis TaxID=309888 RepID=UPI0004804DF7|nr:Ig-like domain-containing protein [Deinococcus pimensis]